MPRISRLPVGFVLLLWATLAAGQNDLGELLDAGARRLSIEEFRRDLVGRLLTGPISRSNELEIVYTEDGKVQGAGTGREGRPFFGNERGGIAGSWTTGDNDTICVAMKLGLVMIPQRCQFWFKLGDEYFISDYDSDRSARVLRRSVKK